MGKMFSRNAENGEDSPLLDHRPLILRVETKERMEKIRKNIPPSFGNFLNHHHRCTLNDPGKSILTEGIKVCKRNDHGMITSVECQACKETFSTAFEDASLYQTRVVCGQVLKPGDHIAFHRRYGIWHHAIVIEDLTNDSQGICDTPCCCMQGKFIAKVKVIEHTFVLEERKFQIRKKNYDIFECMDVCRFEYSASYPPEYTVDLAEATLKQYENMKMTKKFLKWLLYDPFGENCEHFARRCKTGSTESGQVKDCLRDCGKGILMSLLRLVSLFIWFICVAVVEEEKPTMMANNAIIEYENATNATLNNWLRAMELHLSVALSVMFFVVYLIYSVFREISQIRYPPDETSQNLPPTTTECRRETCNEACCYIDDCSCLWCLFCLIICRPCYECFTGCSACSRCCSKTFGRNCEHCGLFCTNYFNVILRVFIREVIASGLPVAAFFLFEKYVVLPNSWNSWIHKDLGLALCGFLVSFGVSVVISMPLGTVVASTIEMLCLKCCLKCCKKTASG